MSFAPRFQPNGGFNSNASTAPAQPLHADIFRPPTSPSASSCNLAKSTGSVLSDISMSTARHAGTAKRKRTSTRESTPLDWHLNMEGAYDGREERRGEFRYTLAGQISTTPAEPLGGAENGQLEDSVYSDVDYRRALGPRTMGAADSPPGQVAPSGTEGAPSSGSWSLFSLQLIGNVVGKVWEFCKKGAFRGFQAGGGQKYNANGATVTETTGEPCAPEPDASAEPVEESSMGEYAPSYSPETAQSAASAAYHDLSTPESTPLPAAKRRQVSANNDELRNWVVVDEPSRQPPKQFAAEVRAAASKPSGLVRPRTGYYAQTSVSSHRRITAPSPRFTGGSGTLASRPSLRISHAGSPALTPREPASFASTRSSPVSCPTPSRIPLGGHRRKHSSAAASATSATTTTGTARSRRQSILPRRSSDIEAVSSPRLDAEALQLAQEKLAAERDADAKVDAFNAKLLSMIRQGREALGTKVEVEMDSELDMELDMEMNDGLGTGIRGGGWEDDD
ncbi:hypothetical protein MYCTH_74446 [Thermothelomyces thermophilus ATCC 42464]|uniref:Uncharacterized protein n=1 Tax=Thermothelomyces thermophilus (strain ATCC 42464 / BCRC 31852 / DSM 1799) TaxID=573729 RepID=G2QLS7_THET4|nr:uncharacterized protein MYCTH_74446 [Thermothelomyces thermophilus ATCC 42464]AEO60907.1 hypothetical protein MYCTH_74446 [Thermothelomyces thermophilus ATCC 42464]